MSDEKVVNFGSAADRHRERKQHERKESRVESMRERFAAALPDKPTPVKDYFKKKRAKKKR
ncbi:tRNA (uracil-5-)-methyltransferase [Marinobacterium sediminicola]|uniref:tRNA (Uracil-5-)-methyltransferase n=1 Tax=Marinobacterium sediminicola TaxID=518898 RepID=A0ABY1RXE1_9GAMM|nr:tRNA (uracil-5-)-methyltransferase [Marinobacterium sediminicola]ULG67807.1 tRNA (uracil-5-)-methyltransferase [Marinobacterium sediminicola]SMR71516.1 hypothetical protein SAMN04487964_102168 [Marinobacterium sediminicola]